VLDPDHVPPVAPEERLARFVLFSRHFRSSDNSVKADAFMPHPLIELSMTRHLQATSDELWQEGGRVATLRSATLYGRADVLASAFAEQALNVEAAPLRENPNHVNASGWPPEKPQQKIKAMEISIRSQFVPSPV